MVDDTRPNPVPGDAPPAAPAPRRSRRAWWWVAAALPLALIAALLLALAALLYHPAALPWALGQVPGLHVEGVQGTLADGRLQIAKLAFDVPDDGGRLQIDELQLQRRAITFRPQPGIWLDLQVEALTLARLQWQSGKPSGQPPTLPQHLRLPLSLRIGALRIGRLQVDQQPPLTDLQAALTLGADGGARHRIDGLMLGFEQNRLHGALALTADAPLTLTARLRAERLQAPAWSATLALDGPLQRLVADARLEGEAPARGPAPALSAQATLRPFAAWPLEALSLTTRELDLSTLSAQLPRTALAGSAQVQSSGMDQPARVEAELVNGLPGTWDAGRLPLRRLGLAISGEPRHTDRLTVDRFELQLADGQGDAGRVSGQGLWQGDAADLQFKLDAVRPDRLDGRAAPINVSGPVTLGARGLQAPVPRLAFDAALTGRALDGSGLPVQLQLTGQASSRHLQLQRAEATAGSAKALVRLDAQADASGWQLRGEAALDRFDPLPWWPGPPGSAWRRGPHKLNGQLALDLHVRKTAANAIGGTLEQALRAFEGQATLRLADSLLAGLPLDGELALRSGNDRYNVDGRLRLADSQLGLQGRIGLDTAADRLALTLSAPALARLAPLGRLLGDASPTLAAHWPGGGSIQASMQAEGRWPALRSQGQIDIAKLASPDATLQQAALRWRAGTGLDDTLSLQLDASGLAQGAQRLDLLRARIDGSLREHQLALSAESPVRPPAWAESLLGPTGTGTRLAIDAVGRWQPEAGSGRNLAEAKGGRWLLQNLNVLGGARGLASAPAATGAASAPGNAGGDVAGAPWLRGAAPEAELRLDAQFAPALVRLAPGRLQLLTTALAWREAQWLAEAAGPGQLTLLAQLETIDVARLMARLQPATGWAGDLTLGGRIEVRSGASFDADIVLERGGGDLTLPDDLEEGKRLPLGLSDLRLALSAHGGVWQFAQGFAGSSIGRMAGAQVLRTTPDRAFPHADAPLSGVIEAQVANLGAWGAWVPPGWRLAGNLRTSASFEGTLAGPEVSGEMRGSGIGLRNLLLGVNLSDGELSISLAGARARIERFNFKGGDGTLSLTGDASLGETPQARLQLKADRFRLLGRIDRRLIASGQADMQLGADSLRVDGDLRLDEGLIDISRSDAPTLDDDVDVHAGGGAAVPAASRAAATPPPALRNAQVAVRIDLGDQLRLRGHGIDTGLRGQLVASLPGGRLALNGGIRTDGGQFAAYGQKLQIRRGEFDFKGALDTARIDVLAVRPNLEVVVGVSVIGPAMSPRIRLHSEPEMPEYDKLSWLMLGRAPDGLGRSDTALLQRAAMAVLAGDGQGATDKVVNAIGLTDFGVSQTDGDTRDTVITLGKQLSERWYVGYERSVNAAAGTWQLIYRAAQRFTLRAQGGNDNALDVIWSWRW